MPSQKKLVWGWLAQLCFCFSLSLYAQAGLQTIIGPPGSGEFGSSITLLTNGYFVVGDPGFDLQGVQNVGAVYLYRADGTLVSRLIGSGTNDGLQSQVLALSNGNFIVHFPNWGNGRGAVTWGSATQGVQGVVSAANSMVGTPNANLRFVSTLRNGNYVLSSPEWDSETGTDLGAVTWCNGATGGCSGAVTTTNSLVGAQSYDYVGLPFPGEQPPIVELANGNFVVVNPYWSNGNELGAGAVTWINGATGLVGTVSAANSLVGSSRFDGIGDSGITLLPNGNYLVSSPSWDKFTPSQIANVGALTWGNGSTGVSGVVSVHNSLIGSYQGDQVGTNENGSPVKQITVLTNGNYVVKSNSWRFRSGAVTWGDGAKGIVGEISESNSYVGRPGDRVGYTDAMVQSVVALSNGNYVFESVNWRNVGAVTWGNGSTGSSGLVSSANSVVGTNYAENIGSAGVVALSNGNYVFASPRWHAAPNIANAGAVTWGNGASGTTGYVSAANSLVGSEADQYVGEGRITALSNGNYVFASPIWHAAGEQLGAVTWGDGMNGTVGTVSTANSLTGARAGDLRFTQLIALRNGNYVVQSRSWRDVRTGAMVGAIRLGNGMVGTTGVISEHNSLVGNVPGDLDRVEPLNNGHYFVLSPGWDDPDAALSNVGAITWGDGRSGAPVGRINANNSLIGSRVDQALGGYGQTRVLRNGSYLVPDRLWDGATKRAGALSWISSNGGTVGPVSATNSLVGTSSDDQLGQYIFEGEKSSYVVLNTNWDNGDVVDAGAVTFADSAGVRGIISARNSIINNRPTALTIPSEVIFDPNRESLFIGNSRANVVTIFYGPDAVLFKSSFD